MGDRAIDSRGSLSRESSMPSTVFLDTENCNCADCLVFKSKSAAEISLVEA